MKELALPIEQLERRIYSVRGQRVILDSELALVYGVTTKRLNEQVKRNKARFPDDFAFQLTDEEWDNLKPQNATSSHGGRRTLPTAFTEHGAIMAASVLNSSRAVEASIFVVRAFVKLREVLASHKQLAEKLDELELRLDGHEGAIREIVTAIRDLAEPLKSHRGRRIGFKVKKQSGLGPRTQNKEQHP